MIQDLPRIPGVPDKLIEAINERLRAFHTGTATGTGIRRRGPTVPPGGGGPAALRLSLAGSTGQVGVAFSAMLVAADGVPPYTYVIAAGTLPPGLLLDALTGTISGEPTTAGLFTFTGSVTDHAGAIVTAPCSINIALPSGASTLIGITGATGVDLGHATDVVDGITRLVSFLVGCTLVFASRPTQYCTIYLSRDGGTTWVWIGWWLFLLSGQQISFPQLRTAAAATWKVAAVPGTINGDAAVYLPTASLPAGAVISAAFPVAALALPAANLGTNPTPATGGSGSWPYNKENRDGFQYWSIPALNITLSAAYADPNIFVITTTFQDYDASLNPIGPEHIYGSVLPVDGTVNIGQLDGDYGTSGFSYVRTGNIAYVRWRLRGSNRADQNTTAWTNPAASRLQTDVGSGAGYVDVLVAAGGVAPPGKILVTYAAGLGPGTQLDPDTGQQVVPNQNSGASLIQDASFQFSTPGTLGAAGLAPGWNYGLGSTATIVIKNDGGNSDLKYARLTNGDASLTQTISVQPGLQFYMQVAARSSNTAGAAHALGLYVDWIGSNGASLSPYTTIVGSVSGYVASWTNPAISGYITAPTGAAHAIVKVSTAMAEPGYWDVDDLLVQAVIQQQANGVTATTGQTTSASGTGVFAAATLAAASGVYGLDYALLSAGNAAAQAMFITPNALICTYLRGSGGINYFLVGNSDSHDLIQLLVQDGAPAITLKIANTTYTGINGTIQDNLGVTHTVKCGLIVS